MRALLERAAEAIEAEQDRWFLWVPALLGFGIAIYFSLPTEPGLLVLAAIFAASAVLHLWRRGALGGYIVSSVAVIVITGVALATARSAWVAAPVVSSTARIANLSGWLELIEPRGAGGHRITLRVTAIEGLEPSRTPHRIRVHARRLDPGLVAGDHVKLRARLSPPPDPAMPGAYDFARQAWFERLGGVGFAVSAPERTATTEPKPYDLHARAAINRLRRAISQRIMSAVPGERGAIADALITGERGGISQKTNDAFRDSGLFHVLSISGLHMAIMAGAVFFSVRLLLSLIPGLALRAPIKKWAAVAASLGALAYLSISGGSLPTVRSFVMIQIMFIAILLDRPALALRNVALAALAILVVTPESLIDVSFQMSFAAVVALVSAYEVLRERRAADDGTAWFHRIAPLVLLGGIVMSTLIASFAVAPFGAYHFHKSQQYAVLGNLMAIPVVNLLIMPAALASLVAMPLGWEYWPLAIMAYGIDAMVWCAEAVARLPGAVVRIPAMPDVAFHLMIGGGIWIALWRTRLRHLGWLAVLAGVALAPFASRPDVIVARDGNLVAVRTVGGTLTARSQRGGQFELGRWLERDGDGRNTADVLRADGIRCDTAGCVAALGRHTVAIARRADALRDDCRRADVVVGLMASADRCKPKSLLIDAARLRQQGAHAIMIRNGRLEIETAATHRGERPWARPSNSSPPARSRYADRTSRSRPQSKSPAAGSAQPDDNAFVDIADHVDPSPADSHDQ